MENNNKYNWDELSATLAGTPAEIEEASPSGPAKIVIEAEDVELESPVVSTPPRAPSVEVVATPAPESHITSWNKDRVAARPAVDAAPVLEKIDLSLPSETAAETAPVFANLSIDAERQNAELQREIAEVKSWAIAAPVRRSGRWWGGAMVGSLLVIGGVWWWTSWSAPAVPETTPVVNTETAMTVKHPKTKLVTKIKVKQPTTLAKVKVKQPTTLAKVKVKSPLKAAAPLKVARKEGVTHPAATDLNYLLQSYYSLRQIKEMGVSSTAQAYTWPELLQILLRLPEHQNLLLVPRNPELRQSVARYQTIAKIHKLQVLQALDPTLPLSIENIREVITAVQTRSSLLK